MSNKPAEKSIPDIWLQCEEAAGQAACGCRLEQSYSEGPKFFFCPLHAAATSLLRALRDALNTIKALDDDFDLRDSYIAGKKAIRKAEPPKKHAPGWFA